MSSPSVRADRTTVLTDAWRAVRRSAVAFKWLVTGLLIGLLAICVLAIVVLTGLLCIVGVGLLLIPAMLGLVRRVAELERRRLRVSGHPVQMPYDALPRGVREAWRTAVHDSTSRRDLKWLASYAVVGTFVGGVALQVVANAVQALTFPAWWRLVPSGDATLVNGLVSVSTWKGAWAAMAMGAVWLILAVALNPMLLRMQSAPGLRWLPPDPTLDWSTRVAELTATRAAALDAHALELRRIERALHDGAQNRLVTVAVLAGAAQRSMEHDPVRAAEILERVQSSAESALAELRSVVRSILPPVLENGGLDGALSALAAQSPVPARLSVTTGRLPASVETTAYFAVAEALTNVAKHSGATRASVVVTTQGEMLQVLVEDDGHGGAQVREGSGLAGIARRAEAHDGTLTVSSPAGGPTVVEVKLPCAS
ncbi:sensor histidine kinase [Flexivirga alba]|uniref:histidine kinase n=1 Tax=Flexivirga alba TaxID=702742 RepID=A0ABW2AJB0_9MICO